MVGGILSGFLTVTVGRVAVGWLLSNYISQTTNKYPAPHLTSARINITKIYQKQFILILFLQYVCSFEIRFIHNFIPPGPVHCMLRAAGQSGLSQCKDSSSPPPQLSYPYCSHCGLHWGKSSSNTSRKFLKCNPRTSRLVSLDRDWMVNYNLCWIQ